MKKDKEKTKYESPQTKKTPVKLESGICATSVDVKNPNSDSGKIESHQVNDDFNFTFDDQEWDNVGQQ